MCNKDSKTLFIYRSSQCSMTSVTKAVVCIILSVGWCIYKRTLAANRKEKPMWRQWVSSHYLSGPLPFVWRHITVNKIFPSFLYSYIYIEKIFLFNTVHLVLVLNISLIFDERILFEILVFPLIIFISTSSVYKSSFLNVNISHTQ